MEVAVVLVWEEEDDEITVSLGHFYIGLGLV